LIKYYSKTVYMEINNYNLVDVVCKLYRFSFNLYIISNVVV